MKNKIISNDAGRQTRVAILESDEEVFTALTKFANEADVTAASLTAIGAFEKATIGWFDFEKKTYKKIEVEEQCEVLSAIGDIAIGDDGKAPDGSTRGGHLLHGSVRPTLEGVVTDNRIAREAHGRSLIRVAQKANRPQPSALGLVPPSAGIHAWMAGAAGVTTLAVMTRASLGHLGQPLIAICRHSGNVCCCCDRSACSDMRGDRLGLE